MLADDQLGALIARFGAQDLITRGVLLVDDEPPNLKVLKSFLEEDYKVYQVASGAEALALAEKTPLDVVIADQRMPGMTGTELLGRLRAVRPDVAGILLTAFADEGTARSAINQAGVLRFLRKPFDPDELQEALAHAMATVGQRRTIAKLMELLAARTDELSSSLAQVRANQEQMLHLERLSTMGQLAAGVLHDLRNVTVSLRAVEFEIAQTATAPELVETLQVGMKGVDSLTATLEAMYQFSRGGLVNLPDRGVAPAAVLKDALAIARMDPNYRSRTVQLAVDDGLSMVRGDQQKLTQVMVNLIRNALQASGERSTVRVRAEAGSAVVLLAVEDDGPGVSAELSEHLFQPFVSTKGKKGMGMGLYMARLIVESHQGQISCCNRPQGGARFQVSLPAISVGK
jgi:signal transduction histidine kinase